MLQSRGFNRSPSITFAKPNTSNHLVLYFPNFVRSTFNSPYSQKALQLTSEVHPSISEVRPSNSEVLPSNSEILPSNSEVLRASLIDAFPTASEVFARLNKVPGVHFVSPIALRDNAEILGSFTLLGNDGLLKIIVFIRNLPFCNKMGGDTFGLKYGA